MNTVYSDKWTVNKDSWSSIKNSIIAGPHSLMSDRKSVVDLNGRSNLLNYIITSIAYWMSKEYMGFFPKKIWYR